MSGLGRVATQQDLDNYINSNGGFGGVVQLKGPSVIFSVYDGMELRAQRFTRDQEAAGFYIPVKTASWTAPLIFEDKRLPNNKCVSIVIFKGAFDIAGVTIDMLYCVAGDAIGMTIVDQYTNILHDGEDLDPQQDWVANGFNPNTGPTLTGVTTETINIFTMSPSDLKAFMYDRGNTQTERVLSVLYMYMPSIRSWARGTYPIIPYDQKVAVGGAPTKTSDSEAICLSILAILGPSFTRGEKLAQQLLNRAKACCASIGAKIPTLAEMTNAITATGWETADSSPHIHEAIGRGIALTTGFKYDCEVKKGDLVDLDTYKAKYHLDPWAAAVYDQARTIYEYYQATSIHFGAAVKQLVEPMTSSLQGVWEAEQKLIDDLSEVIVVSPYVGCVHTIPTGRRIGSVPRITYIGVKYYQKCLTTKAEQDDFAEYKISSIASHISPASDVVLCDEIVNQLPTPSIVSISLLLQRMNIDTAERLMATKSNEIKTGVYYHLMGTAPDSPWFRSEHLIREGNETKRITESISAIIETKYEAYQTKLQREINAELDGERQAELKEEKKYHANRYLQMKEAMTPLSDAVVGPSTGVYNDLRDQLIKKFQVLNMAAISAGPLQNDDAPVDLGTIHSGDGPEAPADPST